MCAPQQLKMEAPNISRFNSQSTSNTTLIGNEHWPPQPFSPGSYGSIPSPAQPSNTIQYPGQWFYLDQVPPKLLKELRRQCDTSPSSRNLSIRPLAKSAAKIKAWARPGKLGIDIKLRRKINAEHDEVTQIRLEPESNGFHLDEKAPLPVELPENVQVSELADVSEPQELPSEAMRTPSRLSSGDSVVDTLPRYEPRQHEMTRVVEAAEAAVSDAPERSRLHRISSSQFSIVATPPRGLSLSRADGETKCAATDHPETLQKDQYVEKSNERLQAPDNHAKAGNLERVNQQLERKLEIRQRYESLLSDLRDELSKQRGSRSESLRLLNGLRIARTTQYETETDVEPPSPSDEAKSRAPRMRKQAVKSKPKRASNKGAPASSGSAVSPIESLGSVDPAQEGLRNVVHEDERSGRDSEQQTPERTSPHDPSPFLHRQSDVVGEHPIGAADMAPGQGGVENPPVASQSVRRQKLPLIKTTFHPASREPSPIGANVVYGSADPWQSHHPPHKAQGELVAFFGPAFSALEQSAISGIQWLQQNYGPEPSLEPGKVRVRWTCSCGHQLYDDFVEKRPGAARELEAYLNRPRTHTGASPITPSSAQSSHVRSPNSSFGLPPSSQTSWSSNGLSQKMSDGKNSGVRPSQTFATLPPYQGYSFPPEPPWLLTCANEDRYTPKLAHLDMGAQKIRSDKDLAMGLRDHYYHVNKKWWRVLRLRGLATIDFVQFEVHQNRFADIRKCPDVPMAGHSDYSFEPGDLLPPVGSRYLLHLFKHPEDYDGELITYLRAPKKTARLQLGVGWGINLVEGFEASKVWLMISMFFAIGSLVFAVAWAWKKHDVQGAFGVAAWVCTLAGLVVGWLQASLG